jgi:hypothetical protein
MILHVVVSVLAVVFMLAIIMSFSFLRRAAGFGNVVPTGIPGVVSGALNPTPATV